jgi:5-methylcytosine-specific restriction endonuclease McrA
MTLIIDEVSEKYNKLFGNDFNCDNIKNKAKWIRDNKDDILFLCENGYIQAHFCKLLKYNSSNFSATLNDYKNNNKNKINQYQKEYRNNNKETMRKYQKKYYKNNKDKIVKLHEEYRKKNPDIIAKATKRYYLKNKDKIDKYRKNYYKNKYKENPDLKNFLYAVGFFIRDYKLSKPKKCELCNNKKNILHGHHYYPKSLFPNLAFDKNNIIILCENCHKLFHRTKNSWKNLIDEQVIL